MAEEVLHFAFNEWMSMEMAVDQIVWSQSMVYVQIGRIGVAERMKEREIYGRGKDQEIKMGVGEEASPILFWYG